MTSGRWPAGDGEMARLICEYDWASTPLGPVEGWPQSLKTAIDMVLAMPGPATILWGPAHVQLYNDAYIAIARDRHPALLGRPAAEGWPDAYEEEISPLLDAVRAGRPTELADYPVALRSPDGRWEERVFGTAWSPIRDESGGVAGALQTLVEATGRKRVEKRLRESEERQAFLLELSDALRPLADPVEVQDVAMRMLGERLALSRAFYLRAERDDTGWVHVVESDYHRAPGMQSVVGRHPLKAFGSSVFAGMEDGKIIEVPDVNDLPGLAPEELRSYSAFDLRAFVNVPLVKGGEYVAAVCVHDPSPRDWTAAETSLIREVAERTWAAVERARAEAALREGEERLRLALEAGEVGAWELDLRTNDSSVRSPRHNEIFGYGEPLDDWSIEAFLDHVHPEDRERVRQRFGEAFETGEWSFESRIVRADGEERWIAARGVFGYEDGEAVRANGTVQDITERKRAEKTLRESENRKAFLLRLSDALRPLSDAVEIQAMVTRTVMDHFGADRCYYCETEDGDAIIRRDAARGGLPSVVGTYPLSSMPIFEAVVDAGRPLVVRDANTTDLLDEELRQLCLQLQITSFVDVPVIKGGRPVGILCITQCAPREWTELEIESAEEAAERAWTAVERARAEEALRESEERHSAIFSRAAAGLSEISLDGRFLRVNDEICRILRRSRRELLETSVPEITHPEHVDDSLQTFGHVVETGEQASLDKRYARPDGTEVWANSTLTRLDDERGRPRAVLVVTVDLTERIRAEAKVRESEERFRTLVEQSPLAVHVFAPDGTSLRSNRSWRELWDLEDGPAGDPTGGNVFDDERLVVSGLVPIMRRGARGEETTTDPVRYDPSEAGLPGETRWLRAFVYPVRGWGGEVREVVLMLQDTTERRELEEERERARSRELTALAEAAERERISRELHDRVAHHMGVAHQSLELFAALREAAPGRAAERLDLARETTRRALDQTRALSAELKRMQEEELKDGLEAAFGALAEMAVPDGVGVDLSVSGDGPTVPKPVGLQVYLAMREAVRNAARHSGCSRIGITLEVRDGEVVGSVEDDGEGFDPEAVGKATPAWGVGLRSMRERTEMLGGGLRLASKPGDGTKVEVRVPLDGR